MEAEHPLIQFSSQEDPQVQQINMMTRINMVPTEKVTHRVIATRTTDDATYFTIKTSTENRAIVNNLLNGNAPAFSIRTIGEFTNDVPKVAKSLEVLGIDYVANPANADSAFLQGTITVCDPITMQTTSLELSKFMGNVSNESLNTTLQGILGDKDNTVYAKTGPEGVAFLIRKETKEVSFESVMSKLKLDIL